MADERTTKETKDQNVGVIAKVIATGFGVVTGVCVQKLTCDILDNVAPTPVSPTIKVVHRIGAFCIGSVVGDAIGEHYENTVLDIAEVINNTRDAVNEVAKQKAYVEVENTTA